MRLVAMTLVLLQLGAACASVPAARAPAAALRDGPVAVRAEALADADAQRRHLGRPLDARLQARIVPVALAVENVGARDLVIVPADLVFETSFGERVPPLHAEALARVFADTLDEYETAPPLSRALRLYEYPVLQFSYDVGSAICVTTIFGCVLLLPPTLVGLVIETTRAVGDRVRAAEGRAAVRAMQQRDDALATVEALVLTPGQTVRGIVYFPSTAPEAPPPRPPALVIRFTDRATGDLAIVVRLDLAPAPR